MPHRHMRLKTCKIAYLTSESRPPGGTGVHQDRFLPHHVLERLLEEYVDGRNKICQRPKNIVRKLQGDPLTCAG